MKPAPIIDVNAVTKRFRIPSVRRHTLREHALDLFRPRSFDELTVLDRISFSVVAGETLGIMGRNGCGKSTLLKVLSGIYQPDGGAVAVRAPITPILELGVGWNPELDAIDNIFLVGAVMGLSLPELRRALDDILTFAELERFANLKLQHYSSGMAARLAYSIAFRAVREVLILDEIFAVGDEAFRLRCEGRFRELRAAGHTILLVSHDPDVITRFADRAILLDGGRVVAESTPQRITQDYLSMLRGPAPSPALAPAI